MPVKPHDESSDDKVFQMNDFRSTKGREQSTGESYACDADFLNQVISSCDHQDKKEDTSTNLHLRSEMVTSGSSPLPRKKLDSSAFESSSDQRLTSESVLIKKQMVKEQELNSNKAKLLDNSPLTSHTLGYIQSKGSSSSCRRGPEPASAIHAENRHKMSLDPVIQPEDYPPEFKEQHFDCVLIYSSTELDQKRALNFKDIIEKLLRLNDGRPPAVCILDRGDNLSYIQSRFKHADVAMERSTYMFLLLTKEFVNDSWADMQKDECLSVSISDPDRKWCVVPLHTKKGRDPDFKYPFGLRALRGLDISTMLKGKNLEDVNPETIQLSDLDEYFVENLKRMFNERLDKKIQREKDQEDKLKSWILEQQNNRKGKN